MKTIPVNKIGYTKSWIVGIDAMDMIAQMAGGACFTHRRLEYYDLKDESDGLVAEFCMDSVELLNEEWVALNPRVIMCVDQPATKPLLTIEEMLSMVKVLIELCNVSSVVWGLAITSDPCYAANMIIEHK